MSNQERCLRKIEAAIDKLIDAQPLAGSAGCAKLARIIESLNDLRVTLELAADVLAIEREK